MQRQTVESEGDGRRDEGRQKVEVEGRGGVVIAQSACIWRWRTWHGKIWQ